MKGANERSHGCRVEPRVRRGEIDPPVEPHARRRERCHRPAPNGASHAWHWDAGTGGGLLEGSALEELRSFDCGLRDFFDGPTAVGRVEPPDRTEPSPCD